MPFVRAGPNAFLLVGRHGQLENRGSALQVWLRPGTIYVLVPGTKQEAAFEFTQETRDGIPLRFKGSFVYRITDPGAAARLFDFATGDGLAQITTLLTHVCLGELRHAVSHMSMVECIEQRKTTLTEVVIAALESTVRDDADPARSWGVEVEVAQVAQVFIVDAQLRQQLEAEVRNEIKLKSDRSTMQADEQINLAELESEGRVDEQRLAVEQARLHRQLEADHDRLVAETPVRLLQIQHERSIQLEELELRRMQNQVKALEVEQELLGDRARQDLRREILPLEQAPEIVKAAPAVLHGTNLSIYGENAQLLGQLAPVFDVLTRAVQQATSPEVVRAPGPVEPVVG